MEILSFHDNKKTLNLNNQGFDLKHRVFNKSLTVIELLSYQQLTEIDKHNIFNNNTIAITSQNAAIWMVKNLNNWSGTVYTNSPKSQLILQDLPNAKTFVSKETYAKKLGEFIQQSKVDSYIHLTGNLGLNELQLMAESGHIQYTRINVYTTKLTPYKLNLNHIDLCIFTSPSQVDSFFKVNKWKKSIFALCIGKTTGQCLENHGVNNQNIYYPQKANYLSMINLLPEIEKEIEQQKTK